MIDKLFVRQKTDLISRDISRLNEYVDLTFDQVAGDFVKYAVTKNILMEVIGRGIDINNHLIAELSDKTTDTPTSYKETFLALIDLKVLPKEFGGKIAKSAGFRNAIVHMYNNLDKQSVYKTIGQAVDQYSQYCRYILNFLEKN